ncbi:MAG: hypothetical protein HY817_03165 [Candidatus Abawacabacteria bacterium]|nr:hypothetical protein [Candidatus Abawacabacteria bacterium]
MGKSALELQRELFPPDINRRNVHLDGLAVQGAIARHARPYLERLNAISKNPGLEPESIPRELLDGIETWAMGVTFAPQSGIRAYLREALAAYASYYRKRPYELHYTEVWKMAREEARFLVGSLDNLLMSGACAAKIWDNAVTAVDGRERNEQLYELLYPFLYFTFLQLVGREDLRKTIALDEDTGGKVRERKTTIHPSSVLERLTDGMTVKDIRDAVKDYYFERASMPGPLLRVKEIVSAEGLMAEVYGDESRIVVRYPHVERAMYSAFNEIVIRADQNDRGVVVDDLKSFEAQVNAWVLSAYDDVLNVAARRRTLLLANELSADFLPHVSTKLSVLQEMNQLITSIDTAISQMVADEALPTIAEVGRLLASEGFMKELRVRSQGPLACIAAANVAGFDAGVEKLYKGLRTMQGLKFVRRGMGALIKKLEALLSPAKAATTDSADTKGVRMLPEEALVFEPWQILLNVLKAGAKEPGAEQIKYLQAHVLPALRQCAAGYQELWTAVEYLEVNWQSWFQQVVGNDPDNSVWSELRTQYSAKGDAPSQWQKLGRSVFGLAPHHRRLSLSGADTVAWRQLKKKVIVGLWIGKPFWTGENKLFDSNDAVAQVLSTFPIYDRPTAFPVTHTPEVLENPDLFFGPPQDSRIPNKHDIYVFTKGSLAPQAVLRYSLGTVSLKHISRRHTTLYTSGE